MAVGVKIVGLVKLQRKFERAKGRAIQRAFDGAMRKGAAIVKKEAKARAPKGETGNLKKSIRSRKVKKLQAGEVGGQIVRARAHHSHLIQLGTGERTQKKSGRNTGRIEPNPFMAEALRATESDVARTIGTEMGKRLIVEMKKL